MKNYVRNECDDHMTDMCDAQDEGLVNSETGSVLPQNENSQLQSDAI